MLLSPEHVGTCAHVTCVQVWCQVLHIITQYLVAVNFSWMFCEGLYLHTIIVVAFATGKKLLVSCLVIGWSKLSTSVFIQYNWKKPLKT